ncbi:hypothetical protein DXG01_003654 [Tephrocybe rancida]|nr:hypothetical protein DXG01_003654 [Tephrocybe rancida]
MQGRVELHSWPFSTFDWPRQYRQFISILDVLMTRSTALPSWDELSGSDAESHSYWHSGATSSSESSASESDADSNTVADSGAPYFLPSHYDSIVTALCQAFATPTEADSGVGSSPEPSPRPSPSSSPIIDPAFLSSPPAPLPAPAPAPVSPSSSMSTSSSLSRSASPLSPVLSSSLALPPSPTLPPPALPLPMSSPISLALPLPGVYPIPVIAFEPHLNPLAQIQTILANVQFYLPHSEQNQLVHDEQARRRYSPDFNVILSVGPPKNDEMSEYLPKRLQPRHRDDPVWRANAQFTANYSSSLFSGSEFYHDIAELESAFDEINTAQQPSRDIIRVVSSKSDKWTKIVRRVKDDIAHIFLSANRSLLPTLWEDLLLVQFLFEISRDLHLRQTSGAAEVRNYSDHCIKLMKNAALLPQPGLNVPLPSYEEHGVFETVPPHIQPGVQLPPDEHAVYLGTAENAAPALFAPILAELSTLRRETLARTLQIFIEFTGSLPPEAQGVQKGYVDSFQWDLFLGFQSVVFEFGRPHTLGGLFLHDLIHHVGLLGEAGLLRCLQTLMMLPGQIHPIFPRPFFYTMVSLAIAAAILYYRYGASPDGVRAGQMPDLRTILLEASHYTRRILDWLFKRADEDTTGRGIRSITFVQDLWLALPVRRGRSLITRHPWVHMSTPAYVHDPRLRMKAEGAALRELHISLHQESVRILGSQPATASATAFIDLSAVNMSTPPVFLVDRHFLDAVSEHLRTADLYRPSQPRPMMPVADGYVVLTPPPYYHDDHEVDNN